MSSALNSQYIESLIRKETYTLLPSGKTVVCELVLDNGFSVIGSASALNAETTNNELGKASARKRAVDKVFELEAYMVQDLNAR